jgi:hypothetical protein
MGRLLEDLTRKMQRKVEKGDYDPLKILVHSTHDTALAALCSTLDVFDEKCDLYILKWGCAHFSTQMARVYSVHYF